MSTILMAPAAAPPERAATPDDEALARIRAAYTEGRYLDAWELARTFAPLGRWRGAAGRVLAGRLAGNLGASRLAEAVHLLGAREHPGDARATYYAALTWARSGPVRALRRMEATSRDHPARSLADWHGLRAHLFALMRDAEAAEASLARALAQEPESPWLRCEESHVHEALDRFDEAIASARRALELRPYYRPALQSLAHLLVLRDRPEEALALLVDAARVVQACSLAAQRAALLIDLGRPAEALVALDEYERAAPLLDDRGRKWLAGARSDAAYLVGDLDACVRHARAAGPFHVALAERLDAGPVETARVELAVPFVRQHRDTCAPASLAMLAAYWRMPVDHLELAARICYDGTPSHAERRWAEEHGWVVRELTLTWDAARALLDRGVPFTLCTVEVTSAHLQVVKGYDARRLVLLIQDPGGPGLREFKVEPLLERYGATGPRAMALVPAAEATRLDGLALPDAELLDVAYRLERALDEHDRPRAAAAVAELEAKDEAHRIALRARASLAAYDGDAARQLAAVERLRERHPDDAPLVSWRLALLRDLGRRDERTRALEAMSAAPPDPVFWQRLAGELLHDARRHDDALWLLRRCARRRPLDPDVLVGQADVWWDRARRDEAVEAYRLASCLADKREGYARAYFVAARALGREEEALRFLRGRQARHGDRSGWPARSLCWALEELGAPADATRALEDALRRRPDDADLLLFAAERAARDAPAEGAARLEAIRGRTHPAIWRRAAARVAGLAGDLPRALVLWREAAAAEPLDRDAHAQVARLLAAVEGPAAAVAHVEAAAAAAPHHVPLQRLWIEHLRGHDPLGAEPAVLRLVERAPDDAWARRELALLRLDQRRADDALREAAMACELDPANAASWTIHADALRRAGRMSEAAARYREALAREVDWPHAIVGLGLAIDEPAARRDALDWVLAEVLRQPSSGLGVRVWSDEARRHLGPDVVREALRAAHRQRPDRRDVAVALVAALADDAPVGGLAADRAAVDPERESSPTRPAAGASSGGRSTAIDEAAALAGEVTARFPLHADAWLEAARVHRARGDDAARLSALERAAQVDPEHGVAAQRLAEALQAKGQLARARTLLERAAARAPHLATSHGYLADVLWALGERDAALARIERALHLDPGYVWAWGQLARWTAERGDPAGRDVALARELATRRPHELRVWVRLARLLGRADDDPSRAEALAALDRATALEPRAIEPHDLRAELLVRAGRFEEALAACRPAAWRGDEPPVELTGRLAWVWGEKGDLERARGIMTDAVAAAPDYAWGLRHLALWSRRADAPTFHDEAERLTKLDPADPMAWGLLGDARRKRGDRAKAREAAARALDLGPDYPFAASMLLDLALEDGELEQADRACRALRQARDLSGALSGEALVACRRRDRAAAAKTFRALCELEHAAEPLRSTASALVAQGWGNVVDDALRAALDAPRADAQLADAWVERMVSTGRPGEVEALLFTVSEAPAWAPVMSAWLERCGDAPDVVHRTLVRWERQLASTSTELWGLTGWALLRARLLDRCASWHAGWESRADVRPWMLLNLSIAQRATGQLDAARATHARALAMPRDGASPRHDLWLALDASTTGDAALAAKHLDATTDARPRFEPYDRFLLGLTEATLAADRGAPGTEVRAALRAARAHQPRWREAITLRRAHDRCLRRVAAAGQAALLLWLVRLLWLLAVSRLGGAAPAR